MANYHLNEAQLAGYVHYTLTDAEREAMSEHLKGCADCRARLGAYEAMERHIRYSLAADIRSISPSDRMTFASVAPRLERRRSWPRLGFSAARLIPSATGLAALAGLAVALVSFFQALSWDSERRAAVSDNPLAVLAAGCFVVAVMGNYQRKALPEPRRVLSRALAFALWAGTAILGLQAIVVLLNLLLWLSLSQFSPAVVILCILPLGVAWIALVVAGGEYHYRHVGRQRSWRLFAWTIAVELLILVLPYVMDSLGTFPRFWH